MILFYGMGGGFGHLTRIKAFISTYQVSTPYRIITANHAAPRFFNKEEILLIDADHQTTKNELAQKIQTTLLPFDFHKVFIDTFPYGILGELTSELINADEINYLARRVIWDNYRDQIGSDLLFNCTYQFEELEGTHQKLVDQSSKEVVVSSLSYASPAHSFDHPILNSPNPIWVITHTTHKEELSSLIEHATDIANIEKLSPQFVVLSDQQVAIPDSAIWLKDQNPIDWYPKASRVFSGAGFNTWHQLKPWREKHITLPFKRRFDDQFWRVKSIS